MATRRERVALELQDDFTAGMAKAAAAAALLSKELNGLDGSGSKSQRSMVSVSKETDRVGASAKKSAANVEEMGSAVRKSGADIDKFSGRLRLLADTAAIIGPGLIPIGAIGIPAVAGLASQLGFAAVAGGVAVAAFQGVGDALTKVNKAALEPTEANLAAAKLAMEQISPAARDFVGELRDMIPALKNLRDIGAENMFPGLTAGLDGLEGALPRVEAIMAAVSRELGDIAADAGESLGGERWAEFLDFVATDAPPALHDMASAVGNVAHAMAELWMAFDPLNDDFGSWLVNATAGLDKWAAGLSETQGFQEFMDYLRTSGPQVADSMAALSMAVLDILEAAAPLGGPVLAGVEAFSKALSGIADSDLGTPIFAGIAALALYNRALSVTGALSRATFSGPMVTSIRAQGASIKGLAADWRAYTAVTQTAQGRAQASASAMIASRAAAGRLQSTFRTTAASAGKAGAAIGGLALLSTGAADGLGVTNTASLALMGTLLGPWGAAIGGATGALLDVKSAGDKFGDTMDGINVALAAGDWDVAAGGAERLSKQLEDINKHTSLGDFIGDTLKSTAGQLTGDLKQSSRFGDTGGKTVISDARRAAQIAAQQRGEQDAASAGRERAAQMMAAAARLEAQGFAATAEGARSASMSVKDFASSITAATAAMTKGSALDAYKSSLLDARDALKDNGSTLDRNTRAGLANRAAIRGMASSALEYAGSMKNAEKRTLFLDKARGDFIGMARALGASAPEARRMAAAFGLVNQGAQSASGSAKRLTGSLKDIPKNVRTQVREAGADKARSMIVDLTRKYNLTPKAIRTLIRESGGRPTKASIDAVIRSARQYDAMSPSATLRANDLASPVIRSATANLRIFDGQSATATMTTVVRRVQMGTTTVSAKADGGEVLGQRQPYGDKVLTMLAPGEEVITNRNGEADRFRRDRAAGVIPAYANGGTVQRLASGGPVVNSGGIVIQFPTPSVVAASVAAAEKIQVAAAKTARSYGEQQDAALEILRGQQRINELEKSLSERGSKRVKGRDGKDDDKRKKGLQDKYKYVGYSKLTGLGRDIATAELAQAKRELADLQNLQEQIDALTEARNSSRDTLTGTGDIFGRGTGAASSVASINRTIADITNYGSMFGRLVGAKASPLLLGQIRAKAESGDFRSAIRLGESLLAQPALLGQLNTSLGTLSAVSSNVATLTTDPRVTSGAAFPGASSTVVKTVNVAVDVGQVATLKADLTREITHNVVAALNGAA